MRSAAPADLACQRFHARLERRIGELQEMGLDAVEVEHPSHNPGMRARLRSVVAVSGLRVTGGSDLHLRDSTSRFGMSGIDMACFERLEETARARRTA